MKERIYVDTNVFIRYLTDDVPEQAEQSKNLFEQAEEGRYELFICDLVAAEIIYVLESVYKISKKDTAEKLLAIIKLTNVVLENKSIVLEALELYEEKSLDFTDAYLACHTRKSRHRKVFSFDKDFKKIDFIELVNQ